jgi:hypothetical protein
MQDDDQTRELAAVEEDGAEDNGSSESVSGTLVEEFKFDKGSWLDGRTDLQDVEVEIGDPINDAVVIRSLSAAQQAAIQDQCLTMKGDTMKVDSRRMQVMRFTRAVVQPKFEEREVEQISKKFGKSFSLVLEAIDDISKATEEDVRKARRRFRPRR